MNQSDVPYPIITVVSFPEYRFLRRLVRQPGISIFLRTFRRRVQDGEHMYKKKKKNFPRFVVIHTVKDFGIVNEADAHVFFLKFWYILYDPTDIGNLISGSSVFSKSSLYIWKFQVHILLKPGLRATAKINRRLTSA